MVVKCAGLIPSALQKKLERGKAKRNLFLIPPDNTKSLKREIKDQQRFTEVLSWWAAKREQFLYRSRYIFRRLVSRTGGFFGPLWTPDEKVEKFEREKMDFCGFFFLPPLGWTCVGGLDVLKWNLLPVRLKPSSSRFVFLTCENVE